MGDRIVLSLFLIGILCLSFSKGVLAEDEEDKERESIPEKTIRLEDVVVTATRTEMSARDVPSSVTVFTKEDIEMSPLERVEDILKITQGIDVNYRYGLGMMGGNRAVNLRGVGGRGNRTLVLIDGVPINNANSHWAEWSLIPKDSVERIEVVRGPSSALYGSNAMGGVINIITRKPDKARETSIEGGYGSFNTWLSRLIQNGKLSRFGYYLIGEYEQTDGYIPDDPKMSHDTKRFQKEGRYFGKLIYEPDDVSSIRLGFSGHNSRRSAGTKYTRGDVWNSQISLNYSRQGEVVDWMGALYINNGKMDFDFDIPYIEKDKKYWNENIPFITLGGIIQPSMELTRWNTLSVGIDYRHEKIKKKYTDFIEPEKSASSEGKQEHLAIFFQEVLRFLDDDLNATLGGRYDLIKNYGGKIFDTDTLNPFENDFPTKHWSRFSPKAGITYVIAGNTILKGSLGMGFSAPSLSQLYSSIWRGSLFMECNPYLKPEKIISFDLGVEHFFPRDVKVSLTFYQSYTEDYIADNTVSSDYWIKDNINEVKIQGLEGELDWRMTDRWSGFANYTYNDSRISQYKTEFDVEGNVLRYTAPHKLAMGLSFKYPEFFDSSIIFTYTGRKYHDNQNTIELEDYYTVDLMVIRRFLKYFKASVRVENMFDNRYLICGPFGAPPQSLRAPGRVITVSGRADF